MSGRLGNDGGFSLVEMLVVLIIMGVVMGGITKMFTAGINSDAALNRRYQSQQDGRLALDKMRREIHGACTVSAAGVAAYNTPVTSVTLYYPGDLCVSGALTVTYCVLASGTHYTLYRKAAATCTASDQLLADYITPTVATPLGKIFDYLPPNSHVTTLGGGAGGIATVDGGSTLPRLHVDMTLNRSTAKNDSYHLVDDIALRNGPRLCASMAATC